MEEISRSGTLYLVGTPIGNLADIAYRAVQVLKEVNLIAAEDTRRTKILLNHYEIQTPLTSYFEYNRFSKGERLLQNLKDGKNVALVSDAGMPGISDPGGHLIQQVIKEGIPVEVIPGPTALVSALVISGLPAHRFAYEGFLSSKHSARLRRLKELASEERTMVFYESPYRLLSMLHDVKEAMGNRQVVCVRELTKKFQEIKRGNVSQLIKYFTQVRSRGEFVVVIGGRGMSARY